jgi:hypothetical protein
MLCTNSTKKSKRAVSAKNTLTGDYRINKALNILSERRLGDRKPAWTSMAYEKALNISTWFYREQNNKNYK